jgi:hypothetical protein
MSTNIVIQDGVVKSLAMRYDANSKPELRWTLEQQSGEFCLYLPCFAPGAAGERLAGELEDGQHILVTSGKLAYRKRTTKAGEVSRLEILVWAADVLSAPSSSPVDERTDADPSLGMSDDSPNAPGGERRPSQKGKPRYPKTTKERWVPSGLASEN